MSSINTRAVLLSAAMICITILVTAILGEVLLRIMGVHSTLVYRPDPHYGWSHTPGSVFEWTTEGQDLTIEINSLGLRDNEYGYEKPAGVYRALVLGDSFAEALQVPLEQNFSKIVEADLNGGGASTGNRYEVLNAGVSGYGTDNALLFYQHEGRKYQPDLVILALFVGNDVRNNWYELENIDAGGFRKPYFDLKPSGLELKSYPFSEHASWGTRTKVFLNRNFIMYSFFRDLRERFRGRTKQTGRNVGRSPVPFDMGIFELEYTEPWEKAMRVTEALLSELNATVTADGTDLLVVLIPNRRQVDPDHPALPDIGAGDWDLEKPNRLLRAGLDANRIDYIDLLPILRTATSENADLYFNRDGHWKASGHEVAAREISSNVRARRSSTVTPVRSEFRQEADD